MPFKNVKKIPEGWRRVTPQVGNLISNDLDGEVRIVEDNYDRISDGTRLVNSNLFAMRADVEMAKVLLKGIGWAQKEEEHDGPERAEGAQGGEDGAGERGGAD